MERAVGIRRGGQDMGVPSGCYKQNLANTRRRKRAKVRIGPGLRECEVGYETIFCDELRLRWRGPLHKKRGGAEHERAMVGVANRTWPIQDRERNWESEIK